MGKALACLERDDEFAEDSGTAPPMGDWFDCRPVQEKLAQRKAATKIVRSL